MKTLALILALSFGALAVTPDVSAQTTYKVKRKGWSRKAKGATVGGVGGAAAGAVIGGGKGAVIGGAAGAAGGYLFGKRRDRKKGDYRRSVIKTKTVR